MEGREPEVICKACGTCSRLDRVFCLGCGRRILALSHSSLRVEDFTTPADRSSLEVLRGTEPLPHLVEKLVPSGRERSESWLSRYGVRVRPPSRLDTLIRGCADVLGLERLPRSYVAPISEANAFSAGKDDDPFLVVCSPVLDSLDYVEIEGLLAHELAHVKSKHVLYHSLAESVASGVQVAATLLAAGLLTVPIRMVLLSWYRESEVSADRAALLMLGGYGRFQTLMVNLTEADGGGRALGVEDGSLTELMQTHPSVGGRLRLAREFAARPEFALGRGKVKAASAESLIMASCSYCGFISPRTEAFCPSCGVSRR